MLPTFGQKFHFFGTWTTLHQFRWLLFEWLALLIKFAELKYRVKVMALAFDLFITDWWRLTLVLYEQACVCIAYCVQPNLWKRLLPHEKHRHRQNHFNCCIYFQNQANICKGKGKKCLRQKEKNVVLLCNITLEKANGRSQKYVDRYEIYLYFYFSFAKWHQGQMVYNLSEHFSYFHLNFWPGEIVILLSHFFLIPQMIPLA